MHYKNGRAAKVGDRVISPVNGIIGILHSVSAQSTCNGRLAPFSMSDPYVTLGECLHLDDIQASTIPDSTLPEALAEAIINIAKAPDDPRDVAAVATQAAAKEKPATQS